MNPSRNVLIDCGTHFGQGLGDFVRRFNVDDSWIVHSFEANPITFRALETGIDLPPGYENVKRLEFVQYHNQALSDHDGTITLQVESPPGEGETGMGTSIIGLDKWNPQDGNLRQNFVTTYDVQCIDFAKFIQTNFNPSDRIIIKMDIEGAEFDVLEHMDSLGVLSYVNFIAVEWHSNFFMPANKSEMFGRENMLKKRLVELGIHHESWY
jgi:FkbM family methyltransferase